jgi:uncharacterized protein
MQVRDEQSGPSRRPLRFHRIEGDFAICRLTPNQPIPEWAFTGAFVSLTRTVNELSIVCSAENVPPSIRAENGWIGFKLEGPFAFSETGVLASFIDPLAKRHVPVFAVSTYDTDYLFIQREFGESALGALTEAGHELGTKGVAQGKVFRK